MGQHTIVCIYANVNSRIPPFYRLFYGPRGRERSPVSWETSLLEHYAHLFGEPPSLPPKRASDHKIQLVPRAQPIKVQPYHYSPIQKHSEKHLKQMLTQGVIRPSTSPFASLVLLVRKKDGTWCFYIDYRHLSAITMKHKHPMLVVDELLDELAGSRWFTKLDFGFG